MTCTNSKHRNEVAIKLVVHWFQKYKNSFWDKILPTDKKRWKKLHQEYSHKVILGDKTDKKKKKGNINGEKQGELSSRLFVSSIELASYIWEKKS